MPAPVIRLRHHLEDKIGLHPFRLLSILSLASADDAPSADWTPVGCAGASRHLWRCLDQNSPPGVLLRHILFLARLGLEARERACDADRREPAGRTGDAGGCRTRRLSTRQGTRRRSEAGYLAGGRQDWIPDRSKCACGLRHFSLRLSRARATARTGTEPDGTCGAPDEFVTSGASPRATRGGGRGGRTGRYSAVGSATTVGSLTAAGSTALRRAARSLGTWCTRCTALPSVEFRITVRGGRGMTAEEMLPLIDAALKQQRYPLVLWQTGTVEAVAGCNRMACWTYCMPAPNVARRRRRSGAGRSAVQPLPACQHRSRSVRERDAAGGDDASVALFHRFDLMRTWANDGRIDLERAPKAESYKALRS